MYGWRRVRLQPPLTCEAINFEAPPCDMGFAFFTLGSRRSKVRLEYLHYRVASARGHSLCRWAPGGTSFALALVHPCMFHSHLTDQPPQRKHAWPSRAANVAFQIALCRKTQQESTATEQPRRQREISNADCFSAPGPCCDIASGPGLLVGGLAPGTNVALYFCERQQPERYKHGGLGLHGSPRITPASAGLSAID